MWNMKYSECHLTSNKITAKVLLIGWCWINFTTAATENQVGLIKENYTDKIAEGFVNISISNMPFKQNLRNI